MENTKSLAREKGVPDQVTIYPRHITEALMRMVDGEHLARCCPLRVALEEVMHRTDFTVGQRSLGFDDKTYIFAHGAVGSFTFLWDQTFVSRQGVYYETERMKVFRSTYQFPLTVEILE